MKADSQLLRAWQFTQMLAIGLHYDLHRRVGNVIDGREGVLEQRVAQLMCRRILDHFSLRVDVEGAERVTPIRRRYCIVSNHLSYLDWVLHLAHFPVSPAFIAKKEVTWYPVIGPYLRSRGVLIDRRAGVGARRAIERAAKDDARWPILIFPEGTRSPDGELKEFRRGGLTVIASQGMPLVPVVILGTHEAYPKGARTVRPGRRLKLLIGEPVDPTAHPSVDGAIAQVRSWIAETYATRRGELSDALPAATGAAEALAPERGS
jgi:1-acyl-sn-glycerol-3-phosphate acyltransferase